MIKVKYRRSIDNSITTLVVDFLTTENIKAGYFELYMNNRPFFVGQLSNLIEIIDFDEEERLLSQAEGQGD